MAINEDDNEIFKISKPYNVESDIPELIRELRDMAIETTVNNNIRLNDCYPELTNDESNLTLTVFKRVKN